MSTRCSIIINNRTKWHEIFNNPNNVIAGPFETTLTVIPIQDVIPEGYQVHKYNGAYEENLLLVELERRIKEFGIKNNYSLVYIDVSYPGVFFPGQKEIKAEAEFYTLKERK
jgi:hypothetical protein